MPRYFTDYEDGRRSTPDDTGTVLDSPERARRNARVLLCTTACDKLPDGQHLSLTATVRDDQHKQIYRATMLFYGQRSD